MMDQGPEGPIEQAEGEPEAGDEQTPPAGDAEALAALEAVLFMAAEPLSALELAEILEVTPAEADALAARLGELYAGRGVQVTRIAGGYQVCTRPEYGHRIAKLHKPERFRLSRAALETLAIVAYKQPVTRPEIESIRGVNSDSAVDTLVQYELVREAGRKEAPGRPMLYQTTQNFLGQFGLNSVDDLPQIDAIPVDEAAVAQEVGARLPAGEQAGAAPDDGVGPTPPETGPDGGGEEAPGLGDGEPGGEDSPPEMRESAE